MCRQLRFIILTAFVLLSAVSYAVVIDEIVATVNGEPVTLAELERILQPVYERYEQVLEGKELMQYKMQARRELLNQLIENKLILQKAEEDGVSLTEAAMEEQLADVKEKFGSLEEFDVALKREGLDIAQYKEELRDQLTVRAMIEREIVPKAKISPETVALYYQDNKDEFIVPEEVHLKNILVKDSKEEIEKIYKDIQEGRDPGDVWVDLGFIPVDRLKPELKEVVESLEVGQNSGIIETEIGYYIILLQAKNPSKTPPLSEIWEVVEDKLFNIKLRQEHKKWIDELKSKAHIEISD